MMQNILFKKIKNLNKRQLVFNFTSSVMGQKTKITSYVTRFLFSESNCNQISIYF